MRTMSFILIMMLLGGCAVYSTEGPAARLDQIYEDAYVCGRIISIKWPELADKTRVAAIALTAMSNPADMSQQATEMLSWFDMNKAEDIALWWAGRRLIRYIGVNTAEDSSVYLGNANIEDIQMALKGYLAGLAYKITFWQSLTYKTIS